MSAELQASRIDAALILTMANPGAGNALHPDMYAAAIETLSTAERDDSIRAVILTGAGNVFCNGVSDSIYSLAMDSRHPDHFVTSLHGWIEAIHDCPKPVIAVVEGMASGAGFSLALSCDFIVAGTSAQFSMPSITGGLTPDSGTWLLARALPRQLALEILIEGKPFSAPKLHQFGLVNRLVDDGDAMQAALAWIEQISMLSGSAIERIKSLMRNVPGHSMTHFSEIEKQHFLESLLWRENPDNPANVKDKKKY